jgi:hypothetical protein
VLVNLYKSKTPLSIFTLPLIAGLVALSLFFRPVTNHTYFFQWQTDLFGMIQNLPWLNFLLTGALISLNAMQMNNVFNRNTFFSKDTFLPGLIYIIGLATLDSVTFSPLLVAHLFLIGGLAFLLQLKRQEPAKNLVFIGSLLLGLAIVFSPLLIPIALLPWISLLVIRPFIWRDWTVALLGLALPLVYHHASHYLATGTWEIKPMDLKLDAPDVVWTISQSAAYLSMFLCILLGSLRFLAVMRSQLVSFKKISQVILFTVLLTTASFIMGWYVYDQLYVSFLIPLGFIIGVQLLYAEKPQVPNIFVNIWFVAAVVNLFLS